MSIDETNMETPEAQETSAEIQIETPETQEASVEVVAETPEVQEVVAEAPVETPEVQDVIAEAPVETPEVKETVQEPITLEIVAPAEFDWSSLGKKGSHYSKSDREKLENLYDKTLSSIVEHEVIDGSVVTMNNREVVVNIGFKSDGVIPLSELRYNPNLKIGDKIEVYVESQEDLNGQLILSHKKARTLRAWERVNTAYDKQEVVTGYVKCRTKGGLIVDIFGIEAFLPGSQIDVKPIRDYDIFVDKVMEFKIVKINHEYKNVVVSHKALIEDELEQQKAEIIAKLED